MAKGKAPPPSLAEIERRRKARFAAEVKRDQEARDARQSQFQEGILRGGGFMSALRPEERD